MDGEVPPGASGPLPAPHPQTASIIERTSLTIEQISKACGFASASHFTRRFKETVGETPGNYRDNRG